MTALAADSENCTPPAGNTRRHLKASTDLREMDNKFLQTFFDFLFHYYFSTSVFVFQVASFSQVFPPKLCTHLFSLSLSHTRTYRMLHTYDFSLINYSTLFGEKHRSCNLKLRQPRCVCNGEVKDNVDRSMTNLLAGC